MSSSGGGQVAELSEANKLKLLLENHETINEVVEVVTTKPALASYGFTEEQAKQLIATVNEIRSALHKMGITK